MPRDRGANRSGGRTPTPALRLEKLLAAHGACVMLIVCEWDGQSWSVLDITSHDTEARADEYLREEWKLVSERIPRIGETITLG